MIGEEPLGVIIKKKKKKRTYACSLHVNQRELQMKECFVIAWIVFPDMLHMGEAIPVRCLQTVLKCRGTCSLIHPRGPVGTQAATFILEGLLDLGRVGGGGGGGRGREAEKPVFVAKPCVFFMLAAAQEVA